MAILSRKEQEEIVLTFERDYGKLLMENNKAKTDKTAFRDNAKILILEIRKTAIPLYFEEDIIEILDGISKSIQQTAYQGMYNRNYKH